MLIAVKLKDIIVDLKRDVDLTALPPEEAIRLIQESYGFLAGATRVEIKDDMALISYDENKGQQIEDEAGKLYNRGVKKAESGDYESAVKLFERALQIIPVHQDARRNLAMAHLEMGKKEEAKNHLIEAVRLDPTDVWAWVLLGNIYTKHEGDAQTGVRFYQKAYEINPNDPYLLTNYATVKMKMGKPAEARQLFERALEFNRDYPNAYFGLAMLHHNEGRIEDAYRTLTELMVATGCSQLRQRPENMRLNRLPTISRSSRSSATVTMRFRP